MLCKIKDSFSFKLPLVLMFTANILLPLILAIGCQTDAAVIGAWKVYTADEATSQHFTIISERVYDLSEFAKVHPGGPDKIAKVIGKDATVDLEKRHGLAYAGDLRPYLVGTL